MQISTRRVIDAQRNIDRIQTYKSIQQNEERQLTKEDKSESSDSQITPEIDTRELRNYLAIIENYKSECEKYQIRSPIIKQSNVQTVQTVVDKIIGESMILPNEYRNNFVKNQLYCELQESQTMKNKISFKNSSRNNNQEKIWVHMNNYGIKPLKRITFSANEYIFQPVHVTDAIIRQKQRIEQQIERNNIKGWRIK
ncbi:Hypothetical_protein [Hexamita inflata]|uniref:Hypothetical_protein n=1 Tax=Hexamita inflata TaxID=28002 RepID=A0AA86RP16_9EUKA|nr:Hypothetical protein HINF_LOCUS63022 [Hexamita inflata]